MSSLQANFVSPHFARSDFWIEKLRHFVSYLLVIIEVHILGTGARAKIHLPLSAVRDTELFPTVGLHTVGNKVSFCEFGTVTLSLRIVEDTAA